jgi:hypothetical protein
VEIPREHQDVLLAMGVAVLVLQTTEKVIRLCMTLVLQRQAPLTLEALQEQEESERNKTLGYFLSELRKRADVHEGFDVLLKDFLRNRNDFIHDLSRVPDWGLGSPEQIAKAKQFVHRLIQQSETVLKVFFGLVTAWQDQVGMPKPSLPNHAWFAEIEAIYKPLADQVFLAKDT